MELGIVLIPVLVLISGAIALIGNRIGREIGRRRLSLFGLRPRYTAQIITISSGVLITATTLIVVLLISQEARVALFRLNEVLTETKRLESEIKQQEDRLKQLALGEIIYLNDQEVLRDVIDGRLPLQAVQNRVRAMVDRAGELAADNGAGADGNGNIIVLTPPNVTWANIDELIDVRDKETVVRLVSSQNTLRGEPLHVYVQLFDNQLVYRKGAELVRAQIDGRRSRDEIGQALLRLADQVSRQARGKVLSPPFTLISAPPTVGVDVDDQRAAITVLQRLGRPATVVVIAAEATSTIGPIIVRYRVQ
ncbi:MAG TPA: DUF3084 domain-containing protein [bacterium]|nr:DUF3084 domain-containing protein [bacterium]